MSGGAPEPSPARMILCALLVVGFAVGVWAYIGKRSAAPAPPEITLPGSTAP